jgi:hypothetical protein
LQRKQKHVKRAKVMPAAADRYGTNENMCRSEPSKPVVWGCQEHVMHEVVNGLRGETHKPGKESLQAEMAQRIIDLAVEPPPGIATHWIGRMPAKAAGVSLRLVQSIPEANRLAPHRICTLQTVESSEFCRETQRRRWPYLILPPTSSEVEASLNPRPPSSPVLRVQDRIETAVANSIMQRVGAK